MTTLCIFFIHTDRGFPIRVGPVAVTGRTEVNRLVDIEYVRRPDVRAIDVWEHDGALYRVPRTASASSRPIPLRMAALT